MRGKVYFMFGLCISHWTKHVALSTESLRKGYHFSAEGGDWTYAVYGACNVISNMINAGIHCDEIYTEAQRYLEFLRDKVVVGVNGFFIPGGFCSVLNLQGKTISRDSFSCQYLDETVFLKTMGTLPTMEAFFFAHKIRSLYLYRSFDSASKVIAKEEIIAAALPAQVRASEACFYSCLMLASIHHDVVDSEIRTQQWNLFERYEQRIKRWSEHCPDNFLHQYYLIQGERARLEHDGLDKALTCYDKAIQSAKEYKFPNMVALGYELKGRFWLERGHREYALSDFREARRGYHLWGAAGKVAMLEEEFAELSIRGSDGPVITPARLDLLSVQKAAGAISAKIEVRDLIHTMMTIVMESAGADRGVLLLERDGAWQIEACADLGNEGVEIGFASNPRLEATTGVSTGVAWSVVNYVLGTQAPVTINEPLRDLRFGKDPYVIRVVPRSILCVPVVNQGRTTGIIYLENKLGPDVFSADRRDVIDILTGQIAISLENATLYAGLKKTEEETRRLNAELEQRVQERTADLHRSNQELEQFAYIASHDLQEPLRKVSSFAQLLASQYKGKLDADADEFIGYMVDGALRMQNLIRSMLAYSRLGRKDQPYAPADTNAVLAQALANLQMAIDESGAVVSGASLPNVLADEVQLVQLFQNLIANAIKFRGAEKPLIHVEAEQMGAEWRFCVRDNGIGIDPQFAERIFVIFQRLHTREEYAGTGIGLAFCKKIVERHGGRIWLESQPPVNGAKGGAVFCFTLPRSNHETAERQNDGILAGARRHPPVGGRPQADDGAPQPQFRA
jgi:signal transduction histidine kinase/tetratricopeptide (TPR) repeat protein